MSRDSPMTELSGFLAKHEPVAKPRLYDIGAVLGEWRVTGFLGSGGNAEVYRVVRLDGTSRTSGTSRTAGTDGRARSPSAPQPQNNENDVVKSVAANPECSPYLAAALKVLLRDDNATRMRFAQEIQLLRENTSPTLARFLDAGVVGRSPRDRRNDGRPYLVTELLEPVDLPTTEKDIADYILAVCRAVGVLHRAGLIHRDIKPSNIMRRANGELVLIDLGLIKNTAKSSEPEKDVSIVSSKVIAVGTPRFAAPEQMTGGAITSATDIHALGRLADMAFHSNPPRCWLPIIRRATSSIPAQRYATVDDMAKAIRHRHRTRQMYIAAGAVLAVTIIGAVVGRARTPAAPQPQHNDIVVEPGLRGAVDVAPYQNESAVWAALCQNTTTNLIVRELAWERLVTNKIGNTTLVSPERAYRNVTKTTDVSVIRLNGKDFEFERPILLDSTREYFVEGPGILAADFRAAGSNVVIHLSNCFFFNRSTIPVGKAGLRYAFKKGAYLNFVSLDEPPRSEINACLIDFDESFNVLRFKGPLTKEALERERKAEGTEAIARELKTISKNLHFPCRFLPTRWKYTVEDMEDSIYKKYGIDPNRIPTDAEVELVAYCFDVSLEEARSILAHRCKRSDTSQEDFVKNHGKKGRKMSHNYSFEKDGKLSGMAASWFVSYAYHLNVDKKHNNWKNVTPTSLASRIKKFNSTTDQHHDWLGRIATMNDKRLSTNKLGLTAESVKKMAKTLCSII